MDIINLRRSVRLFTEQPVEDEKIESILRAAMQAPSAMNQQPWQFLVIRNQDTLKRLAVELKKGIVVAEANVVILLISDLSNLKSSGMYIQDMSAAMQNMLLRATELEVGSCWVGIHPGKERMDILQAYFNLPTHLEPFAMISLGYPKDKDALKWVDRYHPSKVHYEKYHA